MRPPVASFTFSCVDLDCGFDSTGSTDDGSIVSYAWDFDDGTSDTEGTPTGTYTDFSGQKGKRSYTYLQCEGTGLFDQCTNPGFISF